MTPQQETRRQFVKATALAAVTGSMVAGRPFPFACFKIPCLKPAASRTLPKFLHQA